MKSNWHFVDKFGHARRYLNWNPWLARGQDLGKLCYLVPGVPKPVDDETIVENESKFWVKDVDALKRKFIEMGCTIEKPVFQRDEYFDTAERRLSELDYVVRLRQLDNLVEAAFKGPRSYGKDSYARIELEVPTISIEAARGYLKDRGYEPTWFFEKRRSRITHPQVGLKIDIDEIPIVGYFIEIEGTNSLISGVRSKIAEFISAAEMKNYRDIFVEFQVGRGVKQSDIKGAEFSSKPLRKNENVD